MSRLARLARAALFAALAASFAAAGTRPAAATPFSDVPANHWAYQDLQSLAADGLVVGYPSGMFDGNRPLTRYEMAVVVARVVATLQERGGKGASRADLDKLQKLMDALKDELDALGVRVTNVEDEVAGLDRRTKFAQALSLHGTFLPNLAFRQDAVAPTSIVNGTGAPVTTYYGATVNPSGVGGIDPFARAYIASDDTNDPLTSDVAGVQIRQDDRFSLVYAVNDGLTVSLPVHILNFEYGGDFTQDSKFDVEPGVDIALARAGALTNLHFEFGNIETLTSSRTGLAFRAPDGDSGALPFEEPYQPTQKGALVRGTVGEGAFGTTDFEVSFTRVDDTRLDTQPGVTDPNVLPFDANQYFYPVVAPQAGYVQTTPAGALKTDVFDAGTGTLGQVFLKNAAVNGSVYVSSYDGTTFDAAGVATGGAAGVPPAFAYNAAYNDVVFSVPLRPGSIVAITYRSLNVTNDTEPERYMTHARFNQKFKGYAGAQIGVTYNRVFDYTTGPYSAPVSNDDLVSDTVLGIDAQLPLPFLLFGPGTAPAFYGEVANSRYTENYDVAPPAGGSAAVGGLKVRLANVDVSVQYQSVGASFFSGAPLRYYGAAPQLFASNKLGYLPDFFGFGNDLGINEQFDGQFAPAGVASTTASNPNLTFLNPLFNPLKASGPQYYSSFAPNSQGLSASIASPLRIGAVDLTTRGSYQSLQEIAPNGGSTSLYGPTFASDVPLRYTTYTLGSGVRVPAFGQSAAVNLAATYETLKRLDTTPQQYYPVDPGTNAYDAASFAAANVTFPGGGTYGAGSRVSYFPNYVNVRHLVYSAGGSLPIARNLTLGGSYSTQRYGGSYGTTATQNISERKDYYTGALTYDIPNSNSSLTFLDRRFTYHDDVLSTDNFAQNRQDLNFAVRF